MKDKEFINKINDLIDKKRQSDPLQREFNKLTEEIYPYNKLLDFYYLGQAGMLKLIKENLYQYMCKSDRELFNQYIDIVIKENQDNIGKFLKEIL